MTDTKETQALLTRLRYDIQYFDRDGAETDTSSIDYEHGNLCLTVADLFTIKTALQSQAEKDRVMELMVTRLKFVKDTTDCSITEQHVSKALAEYKKLGEWV